MILDNPGKHLTEQEFFTHIRFYNLVCERKDDDEEEFGISDLSLGNDAEGYVYNRIGRTAQILELTVKIERGSNFDVEFNKAEVAISKKPIKEKEKLNKVIKSIKRGSKIKIDDISAISWVWYEIYNHIRFTPSEYKIPQEVKAILLTEIDKYLENLINDRLAIAKKNYYRFEAQKQALITLIEEDRSISLYGKNFIIEEKIDSKCSLIKLPDCCIIQTVYALQKLGYLKVVDVWEELKYPRDNFDREKIDYNKEPNRYISLNVILEDMFIEEINANYKKNNPINVFEKFDSKRGVLRFAGKEINLAKKGKETDAVLLLKTLLKAKGDDWSHNDEILTDWGYNDYDQKDMPKNKVYFAGQKINNAVALKTQIGDFVECNTSKARINPKYKKVDG